MTAALISNASEAAPWHGLAVPIVGKPTPQEILQTASLNWQVKKQAMFSVFEGEEIALLDHYALIRDVDRQVLGICGKEYQPFQNTEVFEFFNKFIEAGQMDMEVAGSFQNGKYIWALAKVRAAEFTLMGNDHNYTYLLLSSPHVWGKALNILFTSIRISCYNTLQRALASKLTSRFRMMHHRPWSEVKSVAQDTIELAIEQQKLLAVGAQFLAEAPAEESQVIEYVSKLLSPNSMEEGSVLEIHDLNDAAQRALHNLKYAPGAHLPAAEGTWWGAFNSVTRFIDHQHGRSGADKRLFEAWLGNKSRVKVQALELAYEYAKAA
jgi:phage/plasmid-like protein (TIGR03299 family)